MLSVFVAALAIAVDIGLARLGYGLLLPAIRANLGGSYSVYGAIGAVHLAGYLAGTIVGARYVSDRAHLPRFIISTHVVVGVGLAGSAFARDPVALGAARAIVGIASGIGIVAVVTDALERVAGTRRGLASTIAWAGIGVGIVISAPAGQWAIADPARWRAVTFGFAGAALIVPLATLALRRAVPPVLLVRHVERAFRWRDLTTRRYAAFVAAYTCFGIAYISYATFAVAAFATRGIVGTTLTQVWLGYGVAAILGALAVGRVLSSRWHRFSLVMPLLGGACGCALSTVDGTFAAIAGAIAVGSSLAATPGVASAFARDRSDAATAAHAFAAVTACFGIGQSAGPLISGALADAFGVRAAALVGAIVFGLGALLASIDASLSTARTAPRAMSVVPAGGSFDDDVSAR